MEILKIIAQGILDACKTYFIAATKFIGYQEAIIVSIVFLAISIVLFFRNRKK